MVKIATKRDDVSAEIDGVWVDYDSEGASVLIARLGNPANRKAYERAQVRYKSKIRKGKLSIEESREITARTLSESIVLDWKGFEDYSGNPLDPTVENFYLAMKHDIDFREWVAEQADISENFRAAEVEENGGKSQAGSGGKSKTAKT